MFFTHPAVVCHHVYQCRVCVRERTVSAISHKRGGNEVLCDVYSTRGPAISMRTTAASCSVSGGTGPENGSRGRSCGGCEKRGHTFFFSIALLSLRAT